MTKLVAPMLSLKASGKFGNDTIFSDWNGRPYAKRYAIPTQPNTAAQITRRLMFRFLMQEWPNLTAESKATWSTLADRKRITQVNAFLAYNLDRWTHFKMPQQEPNLAITSPDNTIVTRSASGGYGIINAYGGCSYPTNPWSIMLFLAPGAAADPTAISCVGIQPLSYAVPTPIATFHIENLPPGTYYPTFHCANDDGRMSTHYHGSTCTVY